MTYTSRQRKRDAKSQAALENREHKRHRIADIQEAKRLGMTVEEYLKYVQ